MQRANNSQDHQKQNIKNQKISNAPHLSQNNLDNIQETPASLPAALPLDSSVSTSWLASHPSVRSHVDALEQLQAIPTPSHARFTRADKAIYDKPVPILEPTQGVSWPMDSFEACPIPPPWPSDRLIELMERESAHLHPEDPLGPLAQQWTSDLCEWFKKLQAHFQFDPTDLASNVRRSAGRWRARLQYLRVRDPERFQYVMDLIEKGHKIPFKKGELPPRSFRHRNPPSLSLDKFRAWEAIKKDISHGAIVPVDLAKEGMPRCVCPVRTADKSNGKARFVHNSRKVNKFIPRDEVQCELETLLKVRNMFLPDGYVIGSDFASGYHCIYVREEDRTFLAFALHISELTDEALEWLRENHPNAYCREKRCYVFKYIALAFGLSSSCKAFCAPVTALTGYWRTLPTEGEPTRVSSYIDDMSSVIKAFRAALRMSIRIVYESASLGLSLQIPKCSFFPRHSIKTLGTIVNLSTFTFRVSRSRARKIRMAIRRLQSAANRQPSAVPARLVASVIGLVWSISTCCHRAASVMLRSIVALLAVKMRHMIHWLNAPLSVILARFWSGSVSWTPEAQDQLDFWRQVDFESLSAPISADVLGKVIESVFHHPEMLDHSSVSMLFQDASATAAGGGMLSFKQGMLRPTRDIFLAEFSDEQSAASSTYRELVGILWCLQATAQHTAHRIVFACDNWQSVNAIRRGSRVRQVQLVAERIFRWCLAHNKVCWPVWLPRTDPVIQEADRLSRLIIPHDDRSPPPVVTAANRLAMLLWHQQLSFDQAASHRSAISINGSQLPFNAFCMQPGASGVDTFRCWDSWRDNINYIFPPYPMTGRLTTFLPFTRSRTILAIPVPEGTAWWHYAVSPHAQGFRAQISVAGFLVTAFDFSGCEGVYKTAHTGLATTACPCTTVTCTITTTTSNLTHLPTRRHRAQTQGCFCHHPQSSGPCRPVFPTGTRRSSSLSQPRR